MKRLEIFAVLSRGRFEYQHNAIAFINEQNLGGAVAADTPQDIDNAVVGFVKGAVADGGIAGKHPDDSHAMLGIHIEIEVLGIGQ